MLDQEGPWKGQDIKSDKQWLSSELVKKSEILNYNRINEDIKNFTNNSSSVLLDMNKIKEIIDKFNNEK